MYFVCSTQWQFSLSWIFFYYNLIELYFHNLLTINLNLYSIGYRWPLELTHVSWTSARSGFLGGSCNIFPSCVSNLGLHEKGKPEQTWILFGFGAFSNSSPVGTEIWQAVPERWGRRVPSAKAAPVVWCWQAVGSRARSREAARPHPWFPSAQPAELQRNQESGNLGQGWLRRAGAACRGAWETCCRASRLADCPHLIATSSESTNLCKRFWWIGIL